MFFDLLMSSGRSMEWCGTIFWIA